MNIEYFDNIDSTNSYFRRKSNDGTLNKDDAVIAWSQKEGRGRNGRGFYSPQGGIYLTISYGFKDLNDTSFLSLMPSSSLALSKLIKSHLGIDTSIKWPNDLLINGKKVVGILAERTIRGDLILGVGINYNIKEFNAELKDIATSLFYENPPITKEEFAKVAVETLLNLHTFAENPKLIDEYNKLCLNIGNFTSIKTTYGKLIKEGIALCVNARGEILISDKNGKISQISSGEVTLH